MHMFKHIKIVRIGALTSGSSEVILLDIKINIKYIHILNPSIFLFTCSLCLLIIISALKEVLLFLLAQLII